MLAWREDKTAKAASGAPSQCLERRVFYKLISGLQASISTHIAHSPFTFWEVVMSAPATLKRRAAALVGAAAARCARDDAVCGGRAESKPVYGLQDDVSTEYPRRGRGVAATHRHARRGRGVAATHRHMRRGRGVAATHRHARRGRGVAATYLHGRSAWQPRRRRDMPPRIFHVAPAVAPRPVPRGTRGVAATRLRGLLRAGSRARRCLAAANDALFLDRVGGHKDRLQNLYFAYLFVLRAVAVAGPQLEHYAVDTGDAEDDAATQRMLRTLVSEESTPFPFNERGECAAAAAARAAFDETMLFKAPEAPGMSPLEKALARESVEELRAQFVLSPRGYAADGSRRRRGWDVDSPRRRVAATPRLGRG